MNGTISLQSKLKGAVSMANTIINGGASPYPKSASGDIITITDGADNTPLKSCVVNIEPVQDLHGYDYPWPAGGGKNLTSMESVTTLSDGGITKASSGQIAALQGGVTYTISFDLLAAAQPGQSDANRLGIYYNNTTSAARFALTATGRQTATFTPPSDCYINFWCGGGVYVGSTKVIDKIQLEKGSTATPFSPYSNLCPISGWTQVNVWVKPTYDTTLTPTANIPLGRTVYGGTLDVVKGKMTITDVGIDMGSIAWSYITTGSKPYFRTTSRIADILPATSSDVIQPILSSRYKPESWSHVIDSTGCDFCICVGWRNEKFVAVADSTYTNANAFTTAVTGQALVYRLATPIEVDLTPQTIKTLLGVNNIWADAGEMSIEYYPAAASIVAVQNRSTKAYVSIPLGMIRYETYQITPQQTIDLDSYRSENGNLLRNPVATKCKLEFNTPLMTDTQWGEIWNIIKAGFNNNTERKLKLRYYDTLSATYKTGYFYVPDVQTTIRNIDEATGTINYNEIRLAFIEY